MPLLIGGRNRAQVVSQEEKSTHLHSRERRGLGIGFFSACANQSCTSAWLHPLRSRTAPIFENGWTCSAECTRAVIQVAIHREMHGHSAERPVHRHRIPLGLLMLEHGWIEQEQLRAALDAQRQAGTGRIGSWLVKLGVVNEEMVTRAVALQWSCPVMSVEEHSPAAAATILPRFLAETFEVLPLRAAETTALYLGFENAPDPVLALAIGRMTGRRVECGVVRESEFRTAIRRMLDAEFPNVLRIEAVSWAAAGLTLAREVERARPAASRLVRLRDYLWLRLWLRPPSSATPKQCEIKDLICSVAPILA